uniref:Uncharacterized protein n=1 Tax=Dicentrarchus labrax TaxID=13489 RepID=A0A8P4GC06_DICLA
TFHQPNQFMLVAGSSRGVGLQLVKEPAKGSSRPATIIATARNPTASTLRHTVIHLYPLSSVSAHCLINNAAAGLSMDINTVTPEATMKTFKVNTVAPLFITKVGQHSAKVPTLRPTPTGPPRSEGRILVQNNDRIQFSLNMVTRCLAADLGSDGILYMSLHPGWVKTDIGGPHVSILPFPNFKLHL